jgi:hypothetical protein
MVEAPIARRGGHDEDLDRWFEEAVADLRAGGSDAWQGAARALESEGWSVRLGLTWVAEARRSGQLERAIGRTRDEVLEQLRQLAMLDDVENCP